MPLSEEKISALRELGHEARTRREELGFSFEDIYQKTRLQPSYLDAIENANYEMLPDTVYTLGFIRTYLGIIKFDELYPEFRHWLLRNTRAAGNTGVAGPGPYEAPTPGFKLASRFWIFMVLLLIVFGAMTYAVYSLSNGFPTNARNDQRADNINGQIVPTVSADMSADVKSADVSADVSVDIPVAVPEPEPVKPELQIIANDDCWISIRVGNGKIADRTLRKGDTYKMELTARTRVHYGRPWAVTIIHNGRDIGAPYKSGVKRQQVNFYDPDGKSGRIEAGQRSQ